MDTLSVPALAEALARLVGVDVGRVQVDGMVAVYEMGPDRYAALQCLIDGGYILKLWTDPSPAPDASGTGPTPEAARDDALSRLRAGYDAVRDVLDPWREGPPDTDGWYEVECEYRVDEAPTEPGVWTDGMWLLPGDASGWPTVAGRPARYRALHLSAPPERGTDA